MNHEYFVPRKLPAIRYPNELRIFENATVLISKLRDSISMFRLRYNVSSGKPDGERKLMYLHDPAISEDDMTLLPIPM